MIRASDFSVTLLAAGEESYEQDQIQITAEQLNAVEIHKGMLIGIVSLAEWTKFWTNISRLQISALRLRGILVLKALYFTMKQLGFYYPTLHIVKNKKKIELLVADPFHYISIPFDLECATQPTLCHFLPAHAVQAKRWHFQSIGPLGRCFL